MTDFAQRLITWQKAQGRHDLPWQQQRNRYRVWVSEIMLQQTQVTTVIPYFLRFMQRFPDVVSLASAPTDDVLALWAGLGYYARARNLHKAAQQVMEKFSGEMPSSAEALETLPGIGRSTAAAIVSLADDVAAPILDGNVKRVFARHAAIGGWPGNNQTLKKLWLLAEKHMPTQQAQAYNQGLMDLGSEVCRRSKPLCERCPLAEDCEARRLGRIAEFPASRPKKVQPQKSAVFLWLEDETGAIWLQQRPPSGVWGGLWCLPQFKDLAALQEALAEHWGVSSATQVGAINELVAQAPVQHVFSHYKLRLEPYKLRLGPDQKTLTIAEEKAAFVPLKQLAEYGLPAPIEKMLRQS